MTKYFLLFLFIPNYLLAQNANYFNKEKEYHYRVIYIDKHGDTITNEEVVLKSLGRAWLPQPKLQTAIRYIYNTDTAGYKNYVDPEDFFHKKNWKYYAKKGKVRVQIKETTGGFYDDTVFYMHPPRVNQYRMLFYAPHPYVQLNKLTDSVTSYTSSLKIYGMGRFVQEHSVTPWQEEVIESSKVQSWKIFVTSNGDIKERFKLEKLYNSTLDAIFTKEFGFIKLYYTFENGIKIQFDFEKVAYL